MSVYKRKNLGLDIFRVIAIVLVLICHAGPNTQPMYSFGFFGVELFFVLSGFLIGQIIIKQYLTAISLKSLLNFWARRWFRTLPLYFLVLLILGLFFNPENVSFWKHFLFIQNFDIHALDWFPVSWSLSIEEWFYLTVPLLFLFIPYKYLNRWSITGILVLFIIAIFTIRSYITIYQNPDYEVGLRKFIPLRLDSLMVGVLLASIKINFSLIYEFLCKPIIAFFSLLFFVLFYLKSNILIYNFIDEKTIPSTIGFTLTSVLFAIMLPYFETSTFINRKIYNLALFRVTIQGISLFTYSIYLIHLPIYNLIITKQLYSIEWLLQLLVALGLIGFLSYLLYNYFEKPIMNLRDKVTL